MNTYSYHWALVLIIHSMKEIELRNSIKFTRGGINMTSWG